MDLKNKLSPIERLMKKRYEEMSPQELKRIRVIISLFFASACIILGILLDWFAKEEIKFTKYILIWICFFLGLYILIPMHPKGKLGKPTKKTKIFFIIVSIGAILGGLIRVGFLLSLYIQNRPLLTEGKAYPIPLWTVILNIVILLLISIGSITLWRKSRF